MIKKTKPMSNHVNSIYIEKDPRYRMQAQLPVHGTGDLFNDLFIRHDHQFADDTFHSIGHAWLTIRRACRVQQFDLHSN